MTKILLDGDGYLLTVPTVNSMRSIHAVHVAGMLKLDANWTQSFPIQSNIHGDKVIYDSHAAKVRLNDMKDHELLSIHTKKKGTEGWVSENFFASKMRSTQLRPCLIPLDKKGEINLDIIQAGNGQILEGGAFFYNVGSSEEPRMIPLTESNNQPARSTQTFCTYDHKQFQFRDSTGIPEETLKWMYWDGMLICMRTVCVCRLKDLLESDLF